MAHNLTTYSDSDLVKAARVLTQSAMEATDDFTEGYLWDMVDIMKAEAFARGCTPLAWSERMAADD